MNIRVLHSRCKARDKGHSRNRGLLGFLSWYSMHYVPQENPYACVVFWATRKGSRSASRLEGLPEREAFRQGTEGASTITNTMVPYSDASSKPKMMLVIIQACILCVQTPINMAL